MRLPLDQARTAALFELLDRLDRIPMRTVLIGGLVPPLLLETIDPDGFAEAPDPRRTFDCDLAVGIALSNDQHDIDLRALLPFPGWDRTAREEKASQFRWAHTSGLQLDFVRVPVGIEASDSEAIAFVRRDVSDIDDLPRFFRGFELALEDAIEIQVEDEVGTRHPLRIAGLASMLAMKLQVWIDRPHRERDAADIGWLLRHLDAATAVAQMGPARHSRPELVHEIVGRLQADFSDEWGNGIRTYARQVKSYFRDDDATEGDRIAAARAVRRFLEGLAAPA